MFCHFSFLKSVIHFRQKMNLKSKWRNGLLSVFDGNELVTFSILHSQSLVFRSSSLEDLFWDSKDKKRHTNSREGPTTYLRWPNEHVFLIVIICVDKSRPCVTKPNQTKRVKRSRDWREWGVDNESQEIRRSLLCSWFGPRMEMVGMGVSIRR